MSTCKIQDDLAVLRSKKRIERSFEGFFEAEGFALIEPTAFQSYDDFLFSNFRQDHTHTVKVLGGDSNIFILRPDITTNLLARIFSGWDQLEPLEVYYNSKVYSTGSVGSIVEHYQMGVESLGHEPRGADLKLIQMASEILHRSARHYILELGSSKFLDGLCREVNLTDTAEKEIRGLIKGKNSHGLQAKLAKMGIANKALAEIFELEGNVTEVLQKARRLPLNGQMTDALEELEKLFQAWGTDKPAESIKLDLAMVPDLDYYDGIIFKGYCRGVAKKVLSGGRYDTLTARFGKEVTAIGFVFDLDIFTRILLEGEQQCTK